LKHGEFSWKFCNYNFESIKTYLKNLTIFLIYSVPVVTFQKFKNCFEGLSTHFMALYFMLSPTCSLWYLIHHWGLCSYNGFFCCGWSCGLRLNIFVNINPFGDNLSIIPWFNNFVTCVANPCLTDVSINRWRLIWCPF